MPNKTAKKEVPTVNWRNKIDGLDRIHTTLVASYQDLQEYRTKHDKMQKSHDNAFDHAVEDSEKDPDLIRSSVTKEGVDIFKSGMQFPDYKIQPIVSNGPEAREKASIARAATEWMIREAGFEEAYVDSKEPWALHGDAYRRPTKVHIGGSRYMPQYEEMSGYRMLLDTEATEVWSKSISKKSTWVAYTFMLSRSQVKLRFGEKIFAHIDEGAEIDTDGYSEKKNNQTMGKDDKFYEYIELQDISDKEEIFLLGKNWLPVKVNGGPAMTAEQPKKLKDLGLEWKKEYKHKDMFGQDILTTHNTAFYVDRKWIRNHGLGERLYRFQKADEAIQNAALNASRIRAVQIPYITGVSSNIAQDRIQDWKEGSAEDVFTFMDISGSNPNAKPEVGVLKFDGVRAEEMRASIQDLYSAYRNYVGISFTRLEVRTGEGLGQSKLIEAEKIKTVEDIVKDQTGKLEHELQCLLMYLINNDGFGLDETMLPYTKILTDEKSVSGEPLGEIEVPKSAISVKDAAAALKDFSFRVYIDMDTIVARNQLAMLEDITKVAGLVDGAVMPDEKKALLGKIFEITKINIPETAFAGVQNETAQGGAGQFQGGGAGAPAPQPVAAPQ